MSKNTKWPILTTMDKIAFFSAKVALSSSAVGALPTVTILESTDNALSASYAPGGILTLNLSSNNLYSKSLTHQADTTVTGTAWAGVYSTQDLVFTATSGTWTIMVGQISGSQGGAGGVIGGTAISGSMKGTNFVDGNAGLKVEAFAILTDRIRPGKF